MPWDPEVYNKFKAKRYEPFFDLLGHVKVGPGDHILDLGCGTGELTKIIADKFPEAIVLGVDTSAEMLSKAPVQRNISFAIRSIEEQLAVHGQWDVIIANASLQWVNDHHNLFPRVISKIKAGGQLAVQMPSQKENVLNQLLYELVQESTYFDALNGEIRHSPLLTLDEYTELIYSNGAKEVLIYQKVYPIIAESTETLFEFISGSALVPYMEKFQEPLKSKFVKEFKGRIAEHFTSAPTVYAFKRILIVASF